MSDKYIPNYRWNLTDLDKVEKNNLKVFSTFACGGGSTMGYKLAGFDVIGANDIDPEMAWHYKENHKPKYYYLEDIRKFRQRDDLPKELYELDILDGSPPCSSFSMAGSREKDWGKKKVFREGQSSQTLDDLFFDFIELARKLQPKVVIAENVKGLIQGNAKGYVKKIINLFNVSGYDVQLFLLNAATMGVPQERERVFFICRRKDLNFKSIKIAFNNKPITVKEATGLDGHVSNSANLRHILANRRPKWWTHNRPSPTVMGTDGVFLIDKNLKQEKIKPPHINLIGSYPLDYVFKSKPEYMIGMSVPPLMTYGVANQIYQQWFKE
jgi:DNA (cytosine-5)-methyltransferase 1